MEIEFKKTRPSRSLAVTLATASFTLSVIILLVIGGIAMFTNILTHQRSIAVQQQLVAQDASKTVGSFIEEQFNVLETAIGLSNPVSVSGSERELVLESLLGLQPTFRQLVLLDSRDHQLAEVSPLAQSSSGKIFDQLTEDALGQIHQSQRYISPIYIDDATSEPLVVMALPVENVFGDFQGTLAVEVNLKFMWDVVDQLKVGETGYAYVVDNQGNLIAFNDTGRVLRGENVQQISEVKEFVDNPNASTDVTPEVASYKGLLGTTVVGTYVPLGVPQWAVVVEIPWAEAYQPIIQIAVISIVAILLMAVLAGLVSLFVSRRLAKPIVELSDIANNVANGNLSMEAKVSGPTEIAQVASTFNEMTSRLRDLIGSLEQRVADRTKALITSAEVSRRLAAILDPRQLASEVVNEVRNAFDYYYAQIYLLDEAGEHLVIAGGTGEAGSAMLARGHSVPKGSGLVGRAAEKNEPVLVSDTSQDPDWLPNELLPDTRAEVAVPISIGDQVLGVLDVQHNQVNGLTENDVTLLESLAGQVAVSLQNARSYEQSRSQAELESLVNVIGQKIQRTTSIEDTLQTAIRELGTAIGASRVRASLGSASSAVATKPIGSAEPPYGAETESRDGSFNPEGAAAD